MQILEDKIAALLKWCKAQLSLNFFLARHHDIMSEYIQKNNTDNINF